jgi:hypothetical protein
VRRIRDHLTYANLMATIAVFLVLSGGTAVALSGSNTVFSVDIVNDQVNSLDVRNDTLSGGGLAAADLKPGSVGSSEVVNGSLRTSDLSSAIPAARVTNSALESTANHVDEALSFDSERYDTAGMHTTTNSSRLTAPVTGIYAVSASVIWSSDPDGSRFVGLRKNGATWIAMQTQPAVAGYGTDQEVTHQVLLQAGDYVEARVRQHSGNPLAVIKVNEASPEFSMTWLAPGP